MQPAPPRLAMVAGEASGDLLAGLLLQGLTARWPGLRSQGIGGPQMARHGFEPWWPYEKLAVRGYVEVLRHYREIAGIRNTLRDRLIADPPDAFIGIDAPDFNLGLEEALRARGIRTVHFICPSIWAWRPQRVEKLRRACDHVLCIFPFEPELLARHGVPASYVGHPLASVIPMEPDRAGARRALGLADEDEVIAVLPGSRVSEIEQMAPRFFAAAALVARARPKARFVVPTLPALQERVAREAARAGVGERLRVVAGQSHAAMAACDLVLVASGTATLEAALFKRPMVIGYAVNWLSYRLMWPQRLLPWVGLPNILANETLVPELLQDRAKPELLAAALLEWLDQPARMAAIQDKFAAMHRALRRDTAQLASDAVAQVLQQG